MECAKREYLPLRLRLSDDNINCTMHTISMRTLIAISIVISSSSFLFGQTALSDAPRRAEISAAWPGCDPKMPDCTKSRLEDFFDANLQIPPEAKSEGAGGVVVMEFVIEKTGLIGEIGAMHDPGMGLVAEATRVIELMKTRKMKWTPAEEGGKRIPFRYIIPVSFDLPAPKKVAPEVKQAPLPVDGIYDVVDQMPQYAGCTSSDQDTVDCTFKKMLHHIKTELNYPEEALKLRVSGQVVVEFIVDADGSVKQPSIIKGIGAGCDEEALRVISAMPAWTPGTLQGQPVPVRMKVPFFFQLPKTGE